MSVTRRKQASIAADRTAIKGMETDVALEPRISINALLWSARPQGCSRHPCSNATLIGSAPADGTSADDWRNGELGTSPFCGQRPGKQCLPLYWYVGLRRRNAMGIAPDGGPQFGPPIRLVQYQRPRPYQPPLSTKMISTIMRRVVTSMHVFLRHEWSQAAYCAAYNSGLLTTCG
jgi:hypothetical protein